MLQTIVVGALGLIVIGTLLWQWREAVLAEHGPDAFQAHRPGFLPDSRPAPQFRPRHAWTRPHPGLGLSPRRTHRATGAHGATILRQRPGVRRAA
jgi:hypothetical protein